MKNAFVIMIFGYLLSFILNNELSPFEAAIKESDKDISLPENGNLACSSINAVDYEGDNEKGKKCSIGSIDKGFKCCYVKKKDSSTVTLDNTCYYFPDKGNVLSDVADSMKVNIICNSNYLKITFGLFLFFLLI